MKKVLFRLIILFLTSRIPSILNPWMKRREKHTFELFKSEPEGLSLRVERPGRRIPRTLVLRSLFSLLILMSWQFLFSRPVILPDQVVTSLNNGFKEYFDKKTFPSYFLLTVFLMFVYLLPGFILGDASIF